MSEHVQMPDLVIPFTKLPVDEWLETFGTDAVLTWCRMNLFAIASSMKTNGDISEDKLRWVSFLADLMMDLNV